VPRQCRRRCRAGADAKATDAQSYQAEALVALEPELDPSSAINAYKSTAAAARLS
jgi:hypothetical protein